MLGEGILVVRFDPTGRDPEIEPDQVGMVLVDQFAGAGEPIVLELPVVGRPVVLLVVGESFGVQVVDVPAVEAEVLGIDRVEIGSTAVIGPVEGPMAGDAESHPFRSDRLRPVRRRCRVWAPSWRRSTRCTSSRTWGTRRGVRPRGPRTGRRPPGTTSAHCVGVEFGGRQLGNEVLVAELACADRRSRRDAGMRCLAKCPGRCTSSAGTTRSCTPARE